MTHNSRLQSPGAFSKALYEVMKNIHPGVEDMELFEFRYALENFYPKEGGWEAVQLDSIETIESRIRLREFYASIQLKPRRGEKIVLDEQIAGLTRMLFVGLATEVYPVVWVRSRFYFDFRGFYFLTRTEYFSEAVKAHLGGKPYRAFERRMDAYERCQGVGYKQFKQANAEVDACFIESCIKLAGRLGSPLLLAIAGPTGAGKTEIVERLTGSFTRQGLSVTTIEMDNFLTDREYREQKGIDSLGKEALHFDLFQACLAKILQSQKIETPRYNFIDATSSHDLQGRLRPGCKSFEIEPANIIFIEGNFPFLLPELTPLIGLKVVYLTDDPMRMKRKWKRDMDYRKKYDLNYFRNRFFREQFLMAEQCYRPQMEICDLVVEPCGAAIWAAPAIAKLLEAG